MEQRTLKLNEFKALYNALETGTVWIDHLLLGFLYWLEEKVIENRSQQVVDEAIARYRATSKEYETHHSEPPVLPIFRESPSETSTSLPEMRLTAPWYVPPDDPVEPR